MGRDGMGSSHPTRSPVAHLLATNCIPTARFMFHTKLNYEKDLAGSEVTMQDFIFNFAPYVLSDKISV